MTTWNLSPLYKKNAVERMEFCNGSKVIVISESFRSAIFFTESEDRPLTYAELDNPDSFELSTDWQLDQMLDGCYLEIEADSDDVTDEELEEFRQAWEEGSFEAVEELGWLQSDTEYIYYGPLHLTNVDTGEEFVGREEISEP